jgi:hypothetical protein
MSSVIGGSSGCVGVSQPDPTGESPVTTAKPPARYGAIGGARPGGFALPSYTTTGDTTRNTTAERHIVRSVKLLLRRANQRQTGDGRRFRNAARNSRRGVSSAQFEANTKFVFYESRLTRRAKQWHYAIMAHSKVAPASRQTRRKESRLSRNAMDERSSFHAGQILRQKISNHPAS